MLAEMLEIDRPRIDGDEDLSRYLEKHRHEFYSSLGTKSWEHCHRFLLDFGRRYLADGDASIDTGPVPECSISSNNKVYIPLSGLNLIKSNDPTGVGKIKKQWQSENMHYVSDFNVVKCSGEYYCEFGLKKVERTTSPRVAASKPRKKKTKVLSIAKLCELIAKAELSNSKAYARVDFNDIQGRSVPGGAVELGKKR
tara:strand:- start:768 stop:1358 length:591 start_codon:yes stop_codon:yes gene_type:complete